LFSGLADAGVCMEKFEKIDLLFPNQEIIQGLDSLLLKSGLTLVFTPKIEPF
jgi:hypothetical protein